MIVVIGGGAAGLMAAGTAAGLGQEVLCLEKNEKLGKKIYITGKGRCNVTNNVCPTDFLDNVVCGNKFLFSAINSFDPEKTIEFFVSKGVKLKTERGNRVFPVSDKSSDIIKALTDFCVKSGVRFKLNCEVKNVKQDNNKYIIETNTDAIVCDKVIVATGGKSYSTTGSNGFGYEIARSFGHKITPILPALCPIITKPEDVIGLEGVSLKNVEIKCKVDGKSYKNIFGEMLFTHNGISGPIVLSLSSYINKFSAKKVELAIDFKPALTIEQLELRLLREFESAKNKCIKSIMPSLLPKSLCSAFLKKAEIDENCKINNFTVNDRHKIIECLKNYPISFVGLENIEYAIITSGGVELAQVNPKTMESKLANGLFFAGEVLDVDALTGGFNLQIAFATGYAAGKGASK